jgi:Fur family ferric uptake transcriptional regulator
MEKHRWIELLKQHDIRPTANRLMVAKLLSAAQRPLSLSELEMMSMTIDKSNIFRTLTLFRKSHLVHVIEDEGGIRYELCMSDDPHEDDDVHPHFHCECCGRIFCLDHTIIPPLDVPEGYVVHTVNYMVKGICPDCESKRLH